MSKILEALEKAAREKGAGGWETGQPQEVEKREVVRPPKLEEKASQEIMRDIFPPSVPEVDPRLVTFLDPQSYISEQFRKLRNRVIHSTNGGVPKAIMVTSALPGEGKTFVAVNLAASIARGVHERVLLVDCDFRRPSTQTYFGIRPTAGLGDYLRGEKELSRLLIKTPIDKLTYLPMGTPPPDPVELLSSERMRNLMAEMKERYRDRYLVVDCTPAVSTTEPRVLATQVDGIILVVKASRTPRDMVLKALDALSPGKVIGIVLNDLQSDHSKYYRM